MCIHALLLRQQCDPFSLDSLAELLPYFRAFKSLLGLRGSVSLHWLPKESLITGLSTRLDAALVQDPGGSVTEGPLTSD